MGPEKLDNTVYLIRGLYDLADMAQSKHDRAHVRLGHDLARRPARSVRRHVVVRRGRAVRRLADRPGERAVVPEALDRPDADGGRAAASTGGPSPGSRRTPTATRRSPGARTTATAAPHRSTAGLFHTGCGGGANGLGEKVVFGLTTSIQSVGEGNYGRLGAGPAGALHPRAGRDRCSREPATGGTPDEQPGAMPEIFPSPDQGANIDRCWTCRSMFMQAWGNYGTAWAVVHQWLGVRPDLGKDRLVVVPQVPAGQTVGRRRPASGSAAGTSTSGRRTRARRTARRSTCPGSVGAKRVVVGHTLPRGSAVSRVVLDGKVGPRLHRAHHQPRARGDGGDAGPARTRWW